MRNNIRCFRCDAEDYEWHHICRDGMTFTFRQMWESRKGLDAMADRIDAPRDESANDYEFIKNLIQKLDVHHNSKHDHAAARINALKSVVQHLCAGLKELVLRVDALEMPDQPASTGKLGSKVAHLEKCLSERNETIKQLNQKVNEILRDNHAADKAEGQQ